jgi:hypothetical protein
MRLIIDSLDGPTSSNDRVPVLPRRPARYRRPWLVRFHGSSYGLRLPAHPRWIALAPTFHARSALTV